MVPCRILIRLSIQLPAHYPLPTDYCNHGRVLSIADKVFCGCSCRNLQPPFGRTSTLQWLRIITKRISVNLISRSHQRPSYDAITVFDFCGTIGRAWIRTMHTRCSYACLPLSYRPLSIVCLQGLCRVLMSLLTIKHSGIMLEKHRRTVMLRP